jgi:hypothetical protein
MRTSLKIKIVLAIVIAIPVLLLLNFYLPSNMLVRVTGTNVIRIDNDSNSNNNDVPGATRDVYEIYADSLDSQTSYVFVNEDLTFYLKFDSATVQSRATSIAANKGVAMIRYIGWRVPILSMIPNVIDVEPADPNDSTLPVAQIVVYLLIIGGIAYVWLRVRRVRQRRAAAAAARAAAEEAERQARLAARNKDSSRIVDDFIGGPKR